MTDRDTPFIMQVNRRTGIQCMLSGPAGKGILRMRELTAGEVRILEECLEALAAHHNRVSVNFRGQFPKRPYGETLEMFRQDVENGKSRIAVAEEGDRVLGFCKVDAAGAEGAVDYLIVLPEARGKGFGDRLFGWALDALRQSGVSRVEVRVVDGNDAIRFYEKYGFRTCSHILRMEL